MDDKENKPLFSIGKIIGCLGLKGVVKIFPSANNPNLLLKIKTLEAVSPDKKNTLQLKVASIKLDKKLLLVSFANYPDRTSVEPLINYNLFASHDQISKLDTNEFWVNDLVGLSVYTLEGRLVGIVCGIIESASSLIEIRPENVSDGKTIIVPFVKDLVPKVDLKAKRIEVKDVPGLLEPQ
jgi:16S rRNA processing protein RimM